MNKQMNERFLECEVKSESTKKSYKTLFDRIEKQERVINKDVMDFSSEDILEMLSSMGSLRMNSLCTKFSLLVKYLKYIGNHSYEKITKDHLLNLSLRESVYYSEELIREKIKGFENKIDQAIIVLMRVYSVEPLSIRDIKKEDIDLEKGIIKLENRVVELKEEDVELIDKALRETDYRMHIEDYSRRIVYDSYAYNSECPYLVKNRINKFNGYGIEKLKDNAIKDRVSRLSRRLELPYIGSTNMIMNGVVDQIIKLESEIGIEFSEKNVENFIKQNGYKVSMYLVFDCKNRLRSIG